MPASTTNHAKPSYSRTFSTNGPSMSAKVYHQPTNLLPPSPPTTPTGVAPSFPGTRPNTWSRQNSHNGKYS